MIWAPRTHMVTMGVTREIEGRALSEEEPRHKERPSRRRRITTRVLIGLAVIVGAGVWFDAGGPIGHGVEVGLTTGLVEKLGEKYPGHRLYGLDRSEHTLERNAASAAARNVTNIQWLRGDYFDVESWSQAVDAGRPGLIFSLHFHELIAAGEERFREALCRLKSALPGWSLLAFEQPRLPHSERASTSETLWLYAQSNILIHHLIGNGRILSREAWLDLGAQAGCRVADRPCNYLGYRAFLFQW